MDRKLIVLSLLVASALNAQIVAAVFFNQPSALHNGYSQTATLALTGASGSTQTNITLLFSFSDAKLATVANGGLIRNLCARNGYNVPCDLIITNDTTCASLTGGYTWGYDGDYSATGGTGHGWVMVPSYTTGGVTPTVCIGKSSVSTYQGGAVGAEFSSTVGYYHLANGTALSAVDFSGHVNGTVNGATVTAGKIDGAAAFSSANIDFGTTSNFDFGTADFTVSAWLNTVSAGTQVAVGGAGGSNYFLGSGGSNALFAIGGSVAGGPIANGAWHYVVGTRSGGVAFLYVDGAVITSTANGSAASPGVMMIGQFAGVGFNWAGSIDDVRFASVGRLANWVATEYANQNSPPSIGGFTP